MTTELLGAINLDENPTLEQEIETWKRAYVPNHDIKGFAGNVILVHDDEQDWYDC